MRKLINLKGFQLSGIASNPRVSQNLQKNCNKQMTTVLLLIEYKLILKFTQGLHGFILNSDFLNFLQFNNKKPCKKKKGYKNCVVGQK